MNSFWEKVKRNPVINAFIAAVLLQFGQDLVANNVDWPHFAGYAAMLCFGVIARMFTVPSKDKEGLITLNKDLLRQVNKIDYGK